MKLRMQSLQRNSIEVQEIRYFTTISCRLLKSEASNRLMEEPLALQLARMRHRFNWTLVQAKGKCSLYCFSHENIIHFGEAITSLLPFVTAQKKLQRRSETNWNCSGRRLARRMMWVWWWWRWWRRRSSCHTRLWFVYNYHCTSAHVWMWISLTHFDARQA